MPGPQSNHEGQDNSVRVFDRLADAITAMNPTEVPPPPIFNGGGQYIGMVYRF